MPQARVNTSFDGPNVDVLIDMGHPLLNRIVDGFIKVGGTGALHAAAQESMRYVSQESANKRSLEKSVNQMGKECLQWGMVAGIYSGMTYTMQEARGVHDWKNALLGGALTGAALSLTDSNVTHERVISSAITGGAIATAAEFLRNLT
ncbi:outer envelope pore protein 16, chloroplastic [Selaginella moellendorffii]|uniref:outer envelope pore protein 16, chloroplastic n=1 Tax=Selaginella moellendorffii TaxID=88036 RepID=UPI000D1CC1BB|nr:outer envelope pore protein 16, chloroplastic [Selaginella moellendorffii]|eukprot:XP_024532204.1 outer envelope pore protein 16, chloroplastic [Selaginella moellendorffii]